jgi:hypothetical protein
MFLHQLSIVLIAIAPVVQSTGDIYVKASILKTGHLVFKLRFSVTDVQIVCVSELHFRFCHPWYCATVVFSGLACLKSATR